MSFSTRKILHRIWFFIMFGAIVLFFVNTGTVHSSISPNFIMTHGKTGEPLSVVSSFILWSFYCFIYGILISGTVLLFERLLFFPILFRGEVVGKTRLRYATLPEYSERAREEDYIGFRASFIIGFGSAFLLILFQILGLYSR